MGIADFEFKTAISLASQIYLEVKGVNGFAPCNFYDISDEAFQSKLLSPNPNTILHEYIDYIHEYGLDYAIDKSSYEDVVDDDLLETLDNYGIEYEPIDDECEDTDEYYKGIIGKYKQLSPFIVNEAFTILFADKRLLRTFNKSIATVIRELRYEDYPRLLSKDGVVQRCVYLPTWLKDGVYFRDKGRCQLCGTDLTRLLGIENKLHYDHIIPLELGGTNDPTNFQLLCESCNLAKGDRHSGTRNLVQVYWDIS